MNFQGPHQGPPEIQRAATRSLRATFLGEEGRKIYGCFSEKDKLRSNRRAAVWLSDFSTHFSFCVENPAGLFVFFPCFSRIFGRKRAAFGPEFFTSFSRFVENSVLSSFFLQTKNRPCLPVLPADRACAFVILKRSSYSSILPKLRSAKSSTRSVRLGATGAALSASRVT